MQAAVIIVIICIEPALVLGRLLSYKIKQWKGFGDSELDIGNFCYDGRTMVKWGQTLCS